MKGRAIARWAFPLILLVLALGLTGCNPFSQGSDSSGETEQESASGTTGAQEPTTETTGAQGSASGTTEGQGASTSQGEGQQTSAENAGPEDALLRYYEAQNAGNWEQAYQLLASQSKQKVSLEQYAGVLSSQPPFTFKYSIVSTNVEGDSARIVIDSIITSEGQNQNRRVAKQLVREDGNWRLVLDETQVESFTQAGQSSQGGGQQAASQNGGVGGQGSTSGGGGDQRANSQSGQQAASQNGGEGANSSQGDREQASAEGPGPQEILLRYYEAYNARNWGQAYQLLASQSKEKVSLEQYTSVLSSQPPFTFKYSIVSTNVEGDSARIVIDSTVTAQGQSQSRRGAKQLVREDGNWRLVLGEGQIESFTQAGQ